MGWGRDKMSHTETKMLPAGQEKNTEKEIGGNVVSKTNFLTEKKKLAS